MIDRIITALLNVCVWLEGLRKEPEAAVTQPYEPMTTEPATVKQDLTVDQGIYLHLAANEPVQCSCVERRNGVLTTLPGCKRCFGVCVLRP